MFPRGEDRKGFLPMPKKKSSDPLFAMPKKRHVMPYVVLLVIVLIFSVIFIYNMLLNTHVAVETSRITVSSLPSKLENFRICVISDLDGQFFGPNQEYLYEAVTSQECSVLCVVGDICDRTGSPRALVRLISRLDPGTKVLFIPGDEDPNPIRSEPHPETDARAPYVIELTEAGAVYLDAPVSVTVGDATVWFCPESVYQMDVDTGESTAQKRMAELMKEPWSEQNEAWISATNYQLDRYARIREAQRTMTSADIQIAVSHAPLSETSIRELHDAYSKGQSIYIGGISLIISGHQNAGVWRLPGGGAIWVPSSFTVKTPGYFPSDVGLRGLQTVLGISQYITSGLGTSSAYPGLMRSFRLFNQPAVSILTLTRKLNN